MRRIVLVGKSVKRRNIAADVSDTQNARTMRGYYLRRLSAVSKNLETQHEKVELTVIEIECVALRKGDAEQCRGEIVESTSRLGDLYRACPNPIARFATIPPPSHLPTTP